MLKIEVDNEDIITRSGVSERTGKEYCMREQRVFIFLPDSKYPKEIKITLDDDAQAYAKGLYTISPYSFKVGRFDQLGLALKLLPLNPQANEKQGQKHV